MAHPNVTQWDAAGPDGDLGAAAGAFRAGVARIALAPGGRAVPAHAAAGQEELLYVVDGAGSVVQEGRPYAIVAGDCVLHRVATGAQALVAGDGGLTVLAFGLRAATAAPPAAQRAPAIVALADVPAGEDRHGRVLQETRIAGRALGAETTGMRHVRIAPGALGTPHHCHGAEEELFVVLGGTGAVRLGDERLPVARGTVVARPPGTGVAHSFVAGDEGLELLGWGTREPNDITYYPDSGKVYLCGVGVIGRLEPCDYWDGEG